METSTETSQCPLKDKLSQVKNLLNDANERLQEEASRYEIFATKSSASSTSAAIMAPSSKQTNGNIIHQDIPTELKRTIHDITTIQSVLSCPVFNRIVNVTDSLSKLSYHLNLRPSIGPTDIDFDPDGELILKPPIEPATFDNLLNSKLDEYSQNFNHSSHIFHNHEAVNGNSNGIDLDQFYQPFQDQMQAQITTSPQFDALRGNGYAKHVQNDHLSMDLMNQGYGDIRNTQLARLPVDYDTEKLVRNGTKSQNLVNGNKHRAHEQSTKVASVAAAFEANIKSPDIEVRELKRPEGQFDSNSVLPNNMNMKRDSKTTRSMSRINEQFDDPNTFGYSNDMYRATNELNRSHNNEIELSRAQSNGQGGNNKYLYDNQSYSSNNNNVDSLTDNSSSLVKLQSRQGVKQNRASPSTSAGSTVRCADECDSGTSSFRSQAAKGALYSPQPIKPKDQSDDDLIDSSIDQEYIEKLCPEMEKIKVKLEKDDSGLGITIAGYTCEEEEISGIFIKSITPGSPADKSGKINLLDQIFAVNGQEILGFSNPEAVNVLRRHNGKVVTLELMRYSAESKHRKLQTLLGNAEPSSSLQNSALQLSLTSGVSNYTNVLLNSQKEPEPASDEKKEAKLSSYGLVSKSIPESIYKNTSILDKTGDYTEPKNHVYEGAHTMVGSLQAHTPVAAQRGGTTNKIIETKQGARNTIDIRSPLCQTTATATYVNKVADIDFCDSVKHTMNSQLRHAPSDEFGHLVTTEEPEWESESEIVKLCKDSSQGLGFTVKDYANPKDRNQSIIMITNLTPGGIAEQDGRLSVGDRLIFVDDINLEGFSLENTAKVLKKTSGQVSLGVFKLKRV